MLLDVREVDDADDGSDQILADKMRLMTLRVINNFGLDIKQFVYKVELLEKIVEMIKSDTCKLKRDAIMTLKNLSYELNPKEREELEKIVTDDFIIEVVRNQDMIRDQALLIIK